MYLYPTKHHVLAITHIRVSSLNPVKSRTSPQYAVLNTTLHVKTTPVQYLELLLVSSTLPLEFVFNWFPYFSPPLLIVLGHLFLVLPWSSNWSFLFSWESRAISPPNVSKLSLRVIFLRRVSSRTACSLWLISRERSRVIALSV